MKIVPTEPGAKRFDVTLGELEQRALVRAKDVLQPVECLPCNYQKDSLDIIVRLDNILDSHAAAARREAQDAKKG